jgi:hypothetical protein
MSTAAANSPQGAGGTVTHGRFKDRRTGEGGAAQRAQAQALDALSAMVAAGVPMRIPTVRVEVLAPEDFTAAAIAVGAAQSSRKATPKGRPRLVAERDLGGGVRVEVSIDLAAYRDVDEADELAVAEQRAQADLDAARGVTA